MKFMELMSDVDGQWLYKRIIIIVLDAPRNHAASLASKSPSHPNAKKEAMQSHIPLTNFFFYIKFYV